MYVEARAKRDVLAAHLLEPATGSRAVGRSGGGEVRVGGAGLAAPGSEEGRGRCARLECVCPMPRVRARRQRLSVANVQENKKLGYGLCSTRCRARK